MTGAAETGWLATTSAPATHAKKTRREENTGNLHKKYKGKYPSVAGASIERLITATYGSTGSWTVASRQFQAASTVWLMRGSSGAGYTPSDSAEDAASAFSFGESKMRFAAFAKSTAIAATLIVSAQTTASPVRYVTYYDDLQVRTNCTGIIVCQVNFSQLPSDSLFMLSKVNCSINSTQPLATATVSASATSGGSSIGRGVSFNLGPALFAANLYFYSVETDARFLIGQGRYPYIQAYTSTFVNANFQMNCGIVGDLVTPIQ